MKIRVTLFACSALLLVTQNAQAIPIPGLPGVVLTISVDTTAELVAEISSGPVGASANSTAPLPNQGTNWSVSVNSIVLKEAGPDKVILRGSVFHRPFTDTETHGRGAIAQFFAVWRGNGKEELRIGTNTKTVAEDISQDAYWADHDPNHFNNAYFSVTENAIGGEITDWSFLIEIDHPGGDETGQEFVPEPSTAVLLLSALVGLAGARKRRIH